jgi:hypothetical protein
MAKRHWLHGGVVACPTKTSDPRLYGITAERFVARFDTEPGRFCILCARAARLALAKEGAPKLVSNRPARSCSNCRSGAINPGHHGRAEDTDLDLCDVCYWRKRAESATWPKPRPISEAPHKTLLLVRVPGLRPEWTMGLFDCCWVDMCCAEAEIEPTHFLPLPPEVL